MTGVVGGISEKDLAEILALSPRMYESVGWGPQKVPDWQTFRSCCHPEGVLSPLSSGKSTPVTVETFIAGMEEQRKSGAVTSLAETELSHHVEAFGNVASVRSVFNAIINGQARKGVTFAVMVRHDGRWVILSAVWDNEAEGKPVPANFQ